MTVGEWRVWPDRLELHRSAEVRKVEPMTMRLLLLLAKKAPETVTRDDIIDRLWDGRAVTDDAVNKQLSKLRAALDGGKDGRTYLRTVPRVGVRLVEPVTWTQAIERPGDRPPNWMTLGVLLLLASLGIWALARPTDWDLIQEPVTAVPGSEVDPALSPDGKMLAYVARSDPTEPFSLYVRAIGSERSQRLTAPDINARVPAWSDDGRIAFVRRTVDGCHVAVGLSTGSFRNVAPCVLAEIGGLTWLDSMRLIVSDHPRNGTSFRLSVLDIASGRRKLLVDPPSGDVGDTRPLMSRDRKTVYFLRSKSVGPSEIYSAAIDNPGARPLSSDGAAINGFALGPSGTLLVSSQRGGEGFGLWSLDPNHRNWRRLLPDGAPGIASAGDGSLAVYSRLDRQVSLWQQPFDGSPGRLLAPSTRIDWSPALSPDEKRLAFISTRTGRPEVWLLNLPGGALQRLTNFGGLEVQDLDWSRDGRMLATAVATDGLFDLNLIDADSGATRRIAMTRRDERQPFFAVDGRSLWFVRRDKNRFQLRSIDLVTGREGILIDDAIRAVPSADGRSAYVAKPFIDGLWRADLTGKVMQKLAPWPDVGRNRNIDVTPAGIWSTAPDSSGGYALMRLDPTTNAVRRIVGLPDLARPSGIAIAGNSVIYARLRREEADLVTLRFQKRR
jgi:Tol biopolymer transport system component/DNA-binding winged helix-turn-helix (wHTH) protein